MKFRHLDDILEVVPMKTVCQTHGMKGACQVSAYCTDAIKTVGVDWKITTRRNGKNGTKTTNKLQNVDFLFSLGHGSKVFFFIASCYVTHVNQISWHKNTAVGFVFCNFIGVLQSRFAPSMCETHKILKFTTDLDWVQKRFNPSDKQQIFVNNN